MRSPRTGRRRKIVLTIAGSDSGGGAGIQADLKTFASIGVFGASAITCVTAQNPDRVAATEALSPDMVGLQVRTVCDYFPLAAAKTGMLYSKHIVRAVADAVRACRIPNLVVDPVMVATSGARLLRADAVGVLCDDLLPLASVITPNLDEAEILCERRIETVDDMKIAARDIAERFGTACLVKGGHLAARKRGIGEVADVLCRGRTISVFRTPFLRSLRTHGTGCVLSAALAAHLALGEALPDAVRGAKRFVASWLKGGMA